MSNFIPMVSSSPPPMDDGGVFGWDDDDDDDFGGFASADTSCKEADPIPATGWNQHDNNTQDIQNDGFADFATFKNSAVTKDRISTGDINSTNEPTGVKNLSGGSSSSKDDIKDTDFHSTLNGQESSAGPLTDSGMFSAETSPVQCNEDQGVSQKSCEHSDSLDDVPTDSLSENVDQNFDSINENSNASHVEMANESRDYKTNNGNDIDNSDSVIVQNISPENTLNNENVTHMCSDGTTSNNESIPGSHLEHSLNSTNVHNSLHDSGIDNMAESIDTNKIDSETKTPGCDITETKTKLTTDEQDSSTVGDNECDNSQTDNNHHEINVNEEEVRKFVDNEVISEAVRRVSESDNAESDNLGHADQSYQTRVSEDSAANNVVLESGKGHDGHNAYSEISGDHEKSFTTKTSEVDSDNTGPEAKTNVEHSDVSDKTSVLHEDNNSHNCHSSSQNSSPEHSDNLQGENNSADKVDKSCDSQSAKSVGDDTEPNESNVSENNEEVLDDEDFGDFSANFSSQDLDFRKSTIPQNDSDLSLSQKGNSVADDLSDSNNDTKDQEHETLSDRESSSLNENNASESKEEKGNNASLEQSTDSLNTLENDKIVVDDDDDFGDFGDFSVIESNQDENKDENSVQQTQVISESADDQFNDDDDDFGDFGNFSSGTTVNANDSVGDNDSFANFATESTESQGDGWAAFNEPQTSEVDTNIHDAADDDWGAFGDEESTSETPAQPAETHTVPSAALQNMTKHEKLVYAVTSCFIENVGSKLDMAVDDLSNADPEQSVKSSQPNSDVWVQIKSLQTSREVSYQWTKSEWNSQLFTTLHIDTRNVLIGHKKAQVPIFAAGLTLLEPVKGTNDGVLKPEVLVDTTKPDTNMSIVLIGHKKAQVPIFAAGLTLLEPVKGTSDGVLKPEVLVDTTKPDSNISQTQEAIPPAQFDWTSSGLTNPLEANNKTLNLDFLIQDQSTKSSELESEFLKPEPAQLTKPAIQPLENILANLKTSSTYKPTVRDQNISTEAQKVVQTLPDLSFMKSRVLMFPIHMDGTS